MHSTASFVRKGKKKHWGNVNLIVIGQLCHVIKSREKKFLRTHTRNAIRIANLFPILVLFVISCNIFNHVMFVD